MMAEVKSFFPWLISIHPFKHLLGFPLCLLHGYYDTWQAKPIGKKYYNEKNEHSRIYILRTAQFKVLSVVENSKYVVR